MTDEKSFTDLSQMSTKNVSLPGVSRTNISCTSVDSGETIDFVATSSIKREETNGNVRNSPNVWWMRYRNISQELLAEDNQQQISFIGLWNKFVRTTTGHGFAKIVDPGEPRLWRIFWAFTVIFLAAGLMTSISIISYESFVERALQREFIVQYNNTMFLPDIHICDTSLFSRSTLECNRHH